MFKEFLFPTKRITIHSSNALNAVFEPFMTPNQTCFMSSSGLLTFESVDDNRKCDHSNESYQAVLSCGALCFLNFLG